MKKYVKPDVLFEDFELSVGVAACSGFIIGGNGQLKNAAEIGMSEVVADTGLFAWGCQLNYEDVGLESYGYYGGDSVGIFGS